MKPKKSPLAPGVPASFYGSVREDLSPAQQKALAKKKMLKPPYRSQVPIGSTRFWNQLQNSRVAKAAGNR